MKKWAKLWVPLALLVFLAPLGLQVPRYFGAGGAWGEWGVRKLEKITGYAPRGMKGLSGLWHAPAADYGMARGGFGYMASAAAGAAVIVVAGMALGRALSPDGRKGKKKDQKARR
ncbi:MAG: hypothetical protein M0Z58_00085 [Nitrospiraceae bacterium]|nr:hypothetical protein [Nitrospiraceae bacterium]